MTCNNCNNTVEDGSMFCPYCGNKIEQNTSNQPANLQDQSYEINPILSENNNSRELSINNKTSNKKILIKCVLGAIGIIIIGLIINYIKGDGQEFGTETYEECITRFANYTSTNQAFADESGREGGTLDEALMISIDYYLFTKSGHQNYKENKMQNPKDAFSLFGIYNKDQIKIYWANQDVNYFNMNADKKDGYFNIKSTTKYEFNDISALEKRFSEMYSMNVVIQDSMILTINAGSDSDYQYVNNTYDLILVKVDDRWFVYSVGDIW